VHRISVHHFEGPAFSSPAVWSVIFQVQPFQSTSMTTVKPRPQHGGRQARESTVTAVSQSTDEPERVSTHWSLRQYSSTHSRTRYSRTTRLLTLAVMKSRMKTQSTGHVTFTQKQSRVFTSYTVVWSDIHQSRLC